MGVVINSNNVVADNIWSGVPTTARARLDDQPTKNGLVVNGSRVTIYGLFNEHHEQYQTLWNGNAGRVYIMSPRCPMMFPVRRRGER